MRSDATKKRETTYKSKCPQGFIHYCELSPQNKVKIRVPTILHDTHQGFWTGSTSEIPVTQSNVAKRITQLPTS